MSIFDNAASFYCIIRVFILCEIYELFFGVAIPLYLFIDISVSSEQQNTCKLSFTCTQLGAERGELRTFSKHVGGITPACSTNYPIKNVYTL